MKMSMKKTLAVILAVLSLSYLFIPNNGMTASASSGGKKAIYVLPGFLGSQLFINDTKIWVGPRIALDILTPLSSPLSYNANGNGMRATEGSTNRNDNTFDEYGTFDTYEALVSGLRKAFDAKYGGTGAYDVIFFSYNWLGDINESVAKLETHINQNGYSKVVFVAHSAGGLLAADYISRGSNKNKVEKAILIGAPLYGTYAALEAIELGTQRELENTISETIRRGFLQGTDVGRVARNVADAYFHAYFKSIFKNSPLAYQLLPSDEYLKNYPIQTSFWERKLEKLKIVLYETSSSYNSASGFYSVLNNTAYTRQINTSLTNGNTSKSHRNFRETVLKNDIASVLMSIGADNVVLIGNKGGSSSTGFQTPTNAYYTNKGLMDTDFEGKLDIRYSYDGDGMVTAFSSTMNNNSAFKFTNYPGVDHISLVKNTNVIAQVISEI